MKCIVSSPAIFVVILFISLLNTAEAINPEKTLLNFFPVSTESVWSFDIAALRNNGPVWNLITTHVIRGRAVEGINTFIEGSHLDIETDVNKIMVGWSRDDGFLVVADLNKELFEFAQYSSQWNSPSEVYLDKVVYRDQIDNDWAVSFVDKHVLLLGTDDTLRKAIDRLVSLEPSALENPTLVDAISSIEEESQLFAVGVFSVLLPWGLAPPMAVDLIDSMKYDTCQLNVDSDSNLTVRVVGDFTSPEKALRATDLLRGFVAIGKMQASQREELMELMEGIQIQTVDSSVHTNVAVRAELLVRLSRTKLQ